MPKRTDDRKSSRSTARVKSTSAKRAATRSGGIAKSVAPIPAARKKGGKPATSRRARATTRPVATVAPGGAGRRSVRPAMRAAVASPPPAAGARESEGCPVQVVTVTDVYSGDPGSSPGSAEFAYRILAEGDSWFTIGGIPSSNLLYEMRLPQPGIVCNIAYPGDTLKHVAELARNQDGCRTTRRVHR
jgi:hypothetical protein